MCKMNGSMDNVCVKLQTEEVWRNCIIKCGVLGVDVI